VQRQEFQLTGIELEPSITFRSGQAFRWTQLDESPETWVGIISGNLVKLSQEKVTVLASVEKRVDLDSILDYFSPNENIDDIFATFPNDERLEYSRRISPGLRLLNQDPWECLVSFLCSINCNIPSIRIKIEKLSRRFGRKIDCGLDVAAYSFPTPESLSLASKKDLLTCSLGFRWRYIKFIAKTIVSGDLDLYSLKYRDYEYALNYLVSSISGRTLGVGPKVADCTLLYSLRKTEAFPIDIWILRCLNKYYEEETQIGLSSFSQKNYFAVSENMRRKFGKYAGYAQLYLYSMMRSSGYSM
jgi:N-glycosylase/DNA lyase